MFYNSEADLFGFIMAAVYRLELIYCRSIPMHFGRDKLMLDFRDFKIEGGLQNALAYLQKLEAEYV